MITLYSHIVSFDTGFAPNPYWGYCTLACCKPVIRRVAEPSDWVIGLSGKNEGYKVIYAMEITEKTTYGGYFSNPKFANKKPDMKSYDPRKKVGDNIYQELPDGTFKQLPSMHSNGIFEDILTKEHDLRGKYVLISDNYYYFGGSPKNLPDSLQEIIPGRGHRKFNGYILNEVIKFLHGFHPGISSEPTLIPSPTCMPNCLGRDNPCIINTCKTSTSCR